MSTAVMPTPAGPRRSNDDALSWGILIGAFVLSIGTHIATVINLPERLDPNRRNKHVEMEFYEPPPPPPPRVEEPKPEPPKPEPIKAKPPPVKVAEVKPPPEQAPPPPNQEPPPETDAKPVPLVVGISLSSTTEGGSFAVNTGNTTYGKADSTPTNPADVKAYRAPKYVPPGGADTQPEVANEFKPAYPDEAKKNEIEGTLVLKVTIDEDGNVTDVKVLKGLGYGLDEASVAAMRRFKFKPATKGGEAVGTTITYKYSWYLE